MIDSVKKTLVKFLKSRESKFNNVVYPLFFFAVLLLLEAGWLGAGITWLVKFYETCPEVHARKFMLSEYFRLF